VTPGVFFDERRRSRRRISDCFTVLQLLKDKLTMPATLSAVLIEELESAFDRRSPERWARIVRRVAKLFLADAHRFNEDQIAVFDDVFLRLIERADAQALALLSNDLCGVSAAPQKAIRQLAFHDDISVAGPVLRRSRNLLDKDLIDIANARGQQHLLEISGRQTLNPSLSDRLVERGETAVLDKLIQNLGARFSDEGSAALVAKARLDDELAKALVRRSDIPPALRRELVAKVSDARIRSMQAMPPALQGKIKEAIATKAERAETSPPTPVDYSAALSRMAELSRKGGLNDRSVNRFAVEHEYVDVAAALSFLSGAPVEVIVSLIESAELEGLMVACKAARLNWSTTTMIIRHRPGCPAVTHGELEQAQAAFYALSLSVAQRTIRLW
jgi:uncharacterized protein (DUF2336 family)